jgi:23S rRNA (guanosine2251-2'-O)-methyltransferase
MVKVRDKKEKEFKFGKREGKSSRPAGAKPDRKPAVREEIRTVAEKKPVKYQTDTEKNAGEDIPRLEGRNPIIEALKAGRTIEKLYIAKGASEGSIRQIVSMARERGIVINEMERFKLDSMSETRNHQGVIAIVSPYAYAEVDDILEEARIKGEQPFIILLDEIYDPHNLGSVIRTANACGAHGVIISKRRAVGLTPTVAKASAGAIEYVKVSKVTNMTQTIKYLKEKGLWVAGADMDGEKMYYEADLSGPIALVIGSEGEGVGKLIKDNCDFIVKMPMKGQISSLNAGVAGAVLMYEVVRQRSLKG